MIEREAERLHVKTGIGELALAGFAGVSGRTWREWQGRQGQERRHNGHSPRDHRVTPEEEAAVLGYRTRPVPTYRLAISCSCW
jgi:Fe-S cluster biosynthesis and repair protein YggX